MENVLSGIMSILWLNGAILLIPGANFLLIIRHAAHDGRRSALLCAFGITAAIMLHVVLSYFFVGYILIKYKIAFELIKYTGALYLLYLAYRMLKTTDKNNVNSINNSLKKGVIPVIMEGFLVDLLNPFVVFFYVSLLATLIKPMTTSIEIVSYLMTIFLITIGWFMLVGGASSTEKIRSFLMKKYLLLNRFAGGAFLWFSFKLATSQIG